MPTVTWLDKPEAHDFPAAANYLGMLTDPATVSAMTDQLHAATVEHKKAKDILRAARLPLLPEDNAHVVSDLATITQGQPRLFHPSCSSAANLTKVCCCRSPTATTACAPATTPTRTPTSRYTWRP